MSDIIEKATKVMHAEVCCPCDSQGCDWTHTREVRYARALAKAGMLTRPLPTFAEAWEEGHEAAAMRVPEGVWHDTASPRTPNPYRQENDS